MKNYKPNSLITSAITTAALSLSITPVFADSVNVFNPANKHLYQRFDIVGITWNTAKTNCETLNGHLATLPREPYSISPENTFVYSNLVSNAPGGRNVNYFIGAYYTPSTLSWTWVTGEHFGSGWTAPPSNYNYFAMYSGSGFWKYSSQSYTQDGSDIVGYICEWDSSRFFVDSATIPDLNGNGVDENASLYLDYKNNKHTVIIRDPKSHITISTLTFATNATPPVGLAVIADMNSNGIPEIAVLSKLNVQIKDAKDNAKVLSSIDFLNSTYSPRSLNVIPDTNNNGFNELTVLGTLKSGKATSETRDSSTEAKLFSDTF